MNLLVKVSSQFNKRFGFYLQISNVIIFCCVIEFVYFVLHAGMLNISFEITLSRLTICNNNVESTNYHLKI